MCVTILMKKAVVWTLLTGADEYPVVLTLTPNGQISTDANAVVTYTHTLRNSGSVTASVALTAVSSQGWVVTVQPVSATLGVGGSNAGLSPGKRAVKH